MAFPKSLLTKDEEVRLDLNPHWWYIAPASTYLAVSVIVALVVLIKGDDWWGDALRLVTGVAVLVALVYFGINYARWRSTIFVVTDERVISRLGVFAKSGTEIPLDRINTVFFSQSVFERLLGAGDLSIESAGEFGKETFTDVRKPSLVQGEIYRQMERFEERRLQRMGQAVAGAQAPREAREAGVPEQIQQLENLRRQGVLSDAEFEAKKQELLKRM